MNTDSLLIYGKPRKRKLLSSLSPHQLRIHSHTYYTTLLLLLGSPPWTSTSELPLFIPPTTSLLSTLHAFTLVLFASVFSHFLSLLALISASTMLFSFLFQFVSQSWRTPICSSSLLVDIKRFWGNWVLTSVLTFWWIGWKFSIRLSHWCQSYAFFFSFLVWITLIIRQKRLNLKTLISSLFHQWLCSNWT